MSDTAVPPIQFTLTGLVLPQETAILAGTQSDINGAFGGNVNPAKNTPQGQLASSMSAIISANNDQFALFVNQVDPDTATGFMQDAIGRIYFMNRNPALPTTVNLLCTGAFDTPIPVGAQARDSSGNVYICQEAGIIPIGGSISLPFANVVPGPIGCPANTVTTIYQAIPGWDTVNNPAPGVAGANVESAAAFEFRRQQSVAKNAHGSLPAIYAAVFAVPGVLDAYVTTNRTGATVNTGATNFPIIAHSVYVAATGGAAQDIGNAINASVSVGCDFNGNTNVTVQDPSGYSIPVPTYVIKYENPTATPVFFAVTIANSALLPADIVTRVQQAIINSFTGNDGSLRARIGALILASKFFAPVSLIGPEVSILSIFVGFTALGATLTNVLMGIDQAPTIVAANISVTLV